MTQPSLPLEGGCRCGQVRLRISAPPMITMACHCAGCQRMTASAFSLSVMIPAAGFEVIQGETVIGGMHSPDLHHHHCPNCLSWIFTRAAGADWFVNVRSPLPDDGRWTTPFMETCVSEKLVWVTTPAKHSFDQFPAMEDYPGLMQGYAESAGA